MAIKTFVIHVKEAYDREEHMHNQLRDKNLEIEFVIEGDKIDLNPSILDAFFLGRMATVSNATSCAYKHLLSYQKMSKDGNDLALILEDDIRFNNDFSIFEKIIREIETRNLKNFILSLEDSNLKYVPRSKRVKRTFIYPQQMGRMTGAYLVDKEAAQNMLQYAKEEKVGLPIDWFHNRCVEKGVIKLYWSHPTIATQGSLDGSINSLIDDKRTGFFRIWSFKLQRCYKRMIYQLR